MNNNDFDLVKILDDLFRIGDENLNRMGQDIGQDSTWEQDDNLKEDQDDDDKDTFDIWDITVEDVERIRKFFTPNVPDVIEDVVQPLIPKPYTLHHLMKIMYHRLLNQYWMNFWKNLETRF
ncbi:hypothetical protein Tco_0191920 [Tanacetum coccineum]